MSVSSRDILAPRTWGDKRQRLAFQNVEICHKNGFVMRRAIAPGGRRGDDHSLVSTRRHHVGMVNVIHGAIREPQSKRPEGLGSGPFPDGILIHA